MKDDAHFEKEEKEARDEDEGEEEENKMEEEKKKEENRPKQTDKTNPRRNHFIWRLPDLKIKKEKKQ